ncbi:MAG TPA: lipopolysaccharide biosynthesis protein, partial [Devosia sp.]|nr:lipopolysaccharide biosynthesis protein [Devosia sp.]
LFSTQFIFKAVRQNTDILVLGLLTTPEIVSSYGVARRVLDSSFLSIEALNRLIYPGSAVVLMNGFHAASGRVRRVLAAAVLISTAAAASIFILSPLMPVLFGHSYPSMVEFTRALCWLVVPMAVGSVALEAFGAAGRQDIRALITNTGNIGAAALVAAVTWIAGINGAFASSYLVEILAAAVVWAVLLRFIQADRSRHGEPVPAE